MNEPDIGNNYNRNITPKPSSPLLTKADRSEVSRDICDCRWVLCADVLANLMNVPDNRSVFTVSNSKAQFQNTNQSLTYEQVGWLTTIHVIQSYSHPPKEMDWRSGRKSVAYKEACMSLASTLAITKISSTKYTLTVANFKTHMNM